MLKLGILLLAITITVSKIGGRWMPAEFRQASRITTWLLAAYIAIMFAINIAAYLRPAG